MAEHTEQLQQLYFTDTESPKILDSRPRSAYLQQRLRNSVNIDLLQLTSRCFLLPDKPTPFAVVLPSQSTYRVTADASHHGKQLEDGSLAVYLKGTSSLQDFMTSRGWTATSNAVVVGQDAEAAPPSNACNAAADSKAACAATAVCANCTTCWQGKFDLILCVRFLERALLPRLRNMMTTGGFIIYSTFVDGPGLRAFGRPSGSEHVLQPGELASIHFGPAQGFTVVEDRVVLTEDGRELCHFVAQLNG